MATTGVWPGSSPGRTQVACANERLQSVPAPRKPFVANERR
jgi:hypothetical protein